MCSSQNPARLLRLRVIADADPGAITGVLNRFQHLNVIPRRVVAECSTDETVHIEVDVFGMPAPQMAFIAAKIREAVNVIAACWYAV